MVRAAYLFVNRPGDNSSPNVTIPAIIQFEMRQAIHQVPSKATGRDIISHFGGYRRRIRG